jgi:uncharacterized membrane protein YjjB (DUF3815 family)
MIPDHARALRTSAVLAMVAAFPSLLLTLALGFRQEWSGFAASFLATIVLAAISGRCAYAYDRLRRRIVPEFKR